MSRPSASRPSVSRLRECLSADYLRLRQVAASGDLAATVPTCPAWTLADLVQHVALVYLEKAENMRTNKEVEWPPAAPAHLPPPALLDHAYAALTAEFDARPPESPTHTWFPADQTVGFIVRRMAQETVIHRVDAELAAGEPVTTVPDDLAADGVDELLTRFLAFGTAGWPDAYGPALAEADGSAVLVAAGEHGWLVTMRPPAVAVEPAPANAPAAGRLRGEPQAVLLWLWRRTDASAVMYDGDPAALSRLRDLLGVATQ
jgi:uncharacterized protein (TIGR03083 family)